MIRNPKQKLAQILAMEKVILAWVVLSILFIILSVEVFFPRHSAPLMLMSFMVVYGLIMGVANLHHRRQLKHGRIAPLVFDVAEAPFISIVVPAHNEALVIQAIVRNLLALDYPHFELLVVDDRSTDKTVEALANVTESLSEKERTMFRYITRLSDAKPGKSAVLNEALSLLKGDIIAVFDADARVEGDFLMKLLPYLQDPDVAAVQARKIISNASVNLLTRCQFHEYLLDAQYQAGRDVIRSAVELRGNGLLVKRQALATVNHWTEDTVTDDLDLSTKFHVAGWDIRFAQDVCVYEEGITQFWPLVRQRQRWTEGSLKRYLEHGLKLYQAKNVAKRVVTDMIAYFFQFLSPLWVALDLLVQGYHWSQGHTTHWLHSALVIPALGCMFMAGLFTAIRYYEKASLPYAFWAALETALYMLLIWLPVGVQIVFKVLFTPDKGELNWAKTEHLGTHTSSH
jgi:1,2-diacylglycerol 3-beta-glucosyltransferase